MSTLPATLLLFALLVAAGGLQYAANLAFLAAFPADSALRSLVLGAELAAGVLVGSGAGAVGRSLRSGPSPASRLRVMVGAEDAPPPPEYPDLDTQAREFAVILGALAAWWMLYAIAPWVIPTGVFATHGMWIAAINVAASLVAMALIVSAAKPLFTPLNQPQRTGII